MGRFDEPDLQVEGQMTIENMYEPNSSLFAVARIFARAKKNMSLGEMKALAWVLTFIKFKDEPMTDIVVVNLYFLAQKIGVNSDDAHLRSDVFRVLRNMRKNSSIDIADVDRKYYDSGSFIRRVTISGDKVRFLFEPQYLGLFTGLTKDYITLWAEEISKMTTKRSMQLYEYLRMLTDGKTTEYDVLLGVRKLKEIFDIPKDGPASYMRKSGGFDRSNFEKNVLAPVCEDLEKCEMISLLIVGEVVDEKSEDGKKKKIYYEKVKEGKRVIGYRFHWAFSARPQITTAKEVKEIKDEAIKDPVMLKVANDIVKGKRKKGKKDAGGNNNNPFNQFEQNQYDFDELEEVILNTNDGDYTEPVAGNFKEGADDDAEPRLEKLPEHYVVAGSATVLDRISAYATLGITDVKVLSKEEYERLKNTRK